MKASRALRRRFRLPNTWGGAATIALALAAIGFAIGIGTIVVWPMVRSGQGVFGYLVRPARPPMELRARLQAQAAPTPISERPELWMTPVAELSFPSDAELDEVAQTGRSVRAVYEPLTNRRVLALPPITDAVGRPIVSVVAAFGHDEDVRTPLPLRPDEVEATQLTIATTAPGGGELGGCVLAFRAGTLQAVGVVGSAALDECRAGLIRFESGAVAFALRYDLLPNHQARDGIWREGAVFGRTEVRAAVRATA